MLDAIETLQIVQFQHLKTQTQSWMAGYSFTAAVRTQLSSALSQLAEGVSLPLHFRMAAGVQRALMYWRRLTNMARVATAIITAQEVLLQTMFTFFKMKLTVSVFLRSTKNVKHNELNRVNVEMVMFNVYNSRINLKQNSYTKLAIGSCSTTGKRRIKKQGQNSNSNQLNEDFDKIIPTQLFNRTRYYWRIINS